jgi:transposase-like protein
MGRTPRRAPNGHPGRGEDARSAIPDVRVESLRQCFARFRRTHKPRTRYPQALRMAVLEALRSGVAELKLRRACGLSAAQLEGWRRGAALESQKRPLVSPPARVYPVVDEIQSDVSDERALHPAGQPVELRIGGWSVCIQRLDE